VGSDRILGVIALEDPPRPLAAQISKDLHAVGARAISMLTGDHRRVAAAVAQRLGIDDVRAELLPEEKADAVLALMNEHQRVAVVGDGVNDAPALASATLGIAMGGAKNDVVLETADVVLMSDDLSRLPFAMRLSQRTRRTIIQNLTFALCVIALLLVGTFYGKIRSPWPSSATRAPRFWSCSTACGCSGSARQSGVRSRTAPPPSPAARRPSLHQVPHPALGNAKETRRGPLIPLTEIQALNQSLA